MFHLVFLALALPFLLLGGAVGNRRGLFGLISFTPELLNVRRNRFLAGAFLKRHLNQARH